MKATKSKAMSAIKTFLQMRQYEIIEEGWKHGNDTADYIARDSENGDLVFIDAKVLEDTEAGFPADKPNRKRSERIAAAYLAQYDGDQSMIRFDIVSLLVLNNDRAMIRHYRNALSAVG